MKNSVIIISIVVIMLISQHRLNSYQPLEPNGLIGSLILKEPLYLVKNSSMRYEKRRDGSASRVVRINGREAFEQVVIEASVKKPVVAFVFSTIGNDIAKMQEVYHDVADTFKGRVRFVSMDLLAQLNGIPENHELMGQLMSMQNITHLQLPIILFFKDGDLYAPSHESAIMLQGFYSKEQLSAFVNNKFFHVQEPIIQSPIQDLTKTTISAESTSIPNTHEVDKKKEEKLSVGQKIKHFFKGK